MMNSAIGQYLWPLLVGTVFFILFGMSAFWIMYQSRTYMDRLIADDVVMLKTIFERIDASCGIRDFEYDKNPINFLNVKSFAGSEVGPMNLRYPKKWEGPYLNNNPTIQEKEYQIVVTNKKEYFIAPGDGVRLGSGKIVGKDIILNKNTDFYALIQQKGILLSVEKRPLAVRIELGKKDNVKDTDRRSKFPSTDVLAQMIRSD